MRGAGDRAAGPAGPAAGGAASRTVLLAGASGLVGGLALRRLIEDPAWERVVVATRRPLPPTGSPGHRPGAGSGGVEVRLVDFARLDELEPVPAGAALCALGTTIKVAGSPAAFRAVDHDAVVAFARWARRGGATTFALVSSVGARARAGNFYLRVKGEAEEALAGLGFLRLVLLRPSLLLGERAERRPGEAIARALAPALNPLLLGPLQKYRGVPADAVAAALVAAARAATPGRHVWEHGEILAAAHARP